MLGSPSNSPFDRPTPKQRFAYVVGGRVEGSLVKNDRISDKGAGLPGSFKRGIGNDYYRKRELFGDVSWTEDCDDRSRRHLTCSP